MSWNFLRISRIVRIDSMRILVIPEDFRKDQYILYPLIVRLFRNLRSAQTNVLICRRPLLGGVREALKIYRLEEIVESYPMVDLFLLCIDRDGEEGRRDQLDRIERRFGGRFLAVNAWEELETWVLAGIQLPSKWRWLDVRAEVNVKEVYFEQLSRSRGISHTLGGGRKILAVEAARNLKSIRRPIEL